MLIVEGLYIILIVILAYFNSEIIKKGRKVWHFGNGLLHITVAGFLSAIWWWGLGIGFLFLVNVVFTISLNLFRKKPLNYMSAASGSFIDKWELKLFGKEFYLIKLSYLAIWLLSITIFYVLVH